MLGMHLVQGLDVGVAQGGDILHAVCSLNSGWIKAHRGISMGRMQSSGAILSKSDWVSYQNLCPGTYLILVPSDYSPFSQDAFLTACSGVMSQPYRCPFCFAHALPVLKEGAGDTLNSG